MKLPRCCAHGVLSGRHGVKQDVHGLDCSIQERDFCQTSGLGHGVGMAH